MIAKRIAIFFAAFATAFSGPLAHAQGISTLRDAEIEKFLWDYSEPIFEAAGLAKGSIEILIVNDQTLNAFAGGRYMGVNTGLLTIAQTPNQIEGVIAHEAAHLAGGHSARTADAAAKASRSIILGLLLAAGAIAAGAPEAGLGAMGLGQNIAIKDFLKYSRGQESTADSASITYLDRLGKSSRGAIELWRNVRNSQIIRGDRINPYLLTHPMANERMTALQSRAEQSPYYDKVDSPEEIYRLKLIQAKIRGFLTDPDAVFRFYPLTDQSDPARYARAVAYFRQSKIDSALSEIRFLTQAHPENPYFHELEGQILFEFGRPEAAIEPHAQSVELLPDNALLRINLGRALLATNESAKMDEAVTEFRRALTLERDNSFGWFELARAYSAMGDDVRADLATAESRFHAGAKPDANSFARRAMAQLEKGSLEWRQAADIILATQPDGAPVAFPEGITPDSAKKEGSEKDEKKQPDVPDPA